jgi:asparagine N-glycosylation enzyme membrane subunit Stt3
MRQKLLIQIFAIVCLCLPLAVSATLCTTKGLGDTNNYLILFSVLTLIVVALLIARRAWWEAVTGIVGAVLMLPVFFLYSGINDSSETLYQSGAMALGFVVIIKYFWYLLIIAAMVVCGPMLIKNSKNDPAPRRRLINIVLLILLLSPVILLSFAGRTECSYFSEGALNILAQ